MENFSSVYAQLNQAQKQAVDTVYGPVLVIAGPGTGKTQLLSARVAHILQVTDALPQNILCLTFTENGAANMRERLTRFIGPAAYDVQIGTYHAFGSTIIGRYPEYFTDLRLERPVDELGKRQILEQIIDRLEYRSPLKQLRHHLGDLVATISEVKRGLLTPDALRTLAADNIAVIERTQAPIADVLAPFAARMPGKLAVAAKVFGNIQEILEHESRVASHESRLDVKSLAELARADLEVALAEAGETGKTTPLTKWKNKWLIKNAKNEFVLAGALEAARTHALAGTLEDYQASLAADGLYDFDDMILRAIEVLAANDDLRYSLQEQYQFLLLDEFQDTNAAQLRMVQLLTDNPVHEGKPNVLAVGDDDQAIYAFQGAEASNMLDFYQMYKDVQVIPLTENYRSRAEILETSTNVATQIEARLHTHFDGITKHLQAKNDQLPAASITRTQFLSSVAEHDGVARQIAALITKGVPPQAIAVLAPKHSYLEALVPYLRECSVPVAYEKREDIWRSPIIRQLLTMSRLVLALHGSNHRLADSLWPEVLSYDFWDFTVGDIWRMSWQAAAEHKPWAALLIEHAEFKHAALLMLALAGRVQTETLETMLDALIGTEAVDTHDRTLPSVRSPFRDYYLKKQGDAVLYQTTTELTVLRSKLRERQAASNVLLLPDLIDFAAAYESAGQPLLNTSPYHQAADAVQLMTVYKAKGLEFDHVFLVACSNDVWGSRASGQNNKLTLPANLAHIRHAGATDDERLRLLFVAVSRARYGLHLSSHAQSFSGKQTEAVKYFDEIRDDGTLRCGILPAKFAAAQTDAAEPPSLQTMTLGWQQRHMQAIADTASLRDLLAERLSRYQLSPTHLTHFLDLKYGGPESFLLGTLLRFPSAPGIDSGFGNAVHKALEWLQNELNRTGELPDATAVTSQTAAFLAREVLTPEQLALQTLRAEYALTQFLGEKHRMFTAGNKAEQNFRDEGVIIGGVHLGGKIDLLEIDRKNRLITVVDYKTGQPGSDSAKLHRYTLQLYCYKLLVEHSHTYRGYHVDQGRLVFVEPDPASGNITEKTIHFTAAEAERVQKLLQAMWRHVMNVDMPDTSDYSDSFASLKRFEAELIAGAIAASEH